MLLGAFGAVNGWFPPGGLGAPSEVFGCVPSASGVTGWDVARRALTNRRVIPACAGSGPCLALVRSAQWCHPRVCGSRLIDLMV